jgi:hypothetical protein
LDRYQNAFEIAKNVVIPKSKNPETFLHQLAISCRVRGRFIVLPAVYFDDDPSFATNEIADVFAYRLLPYKFMPVDLPVANTIPENCFRVCLIDSQLPRDSDHLTIWTTHCHAPHPETSLRDASDLSPQSAGRG